MEDSLIWKWSSACQYSSSSSYKAMFLGQLALLGTKELWKVRASNEYKFFFWLAIQNKCWTSERPARHGLKNNGPCALCGQSDETISHLVLGCVYSRVIWSHGLRH